MKSTIQINNSSGTSTCIKIFLNSFVHSQHQSTPSCGPLKSTSLQTILWHIGFNNTSSGCQLATDGDQKPTRLGRAMSSWWIKHQLCPTATKSNSHSPWFWLNLTMKPTEKSRKNIAVGSRWCWTPAWHVDVGHHLSENCPKSNS